MKIRSIYLVVINLVITALILTSCGAAKATGSHTLEVNIDPMSGGTVSPNGVNSYSANEKVGITAVAAAGFKFTSWSGDVPDGQDKTSRKITVTMNKDRKLQANFEKIAGVAMYKWSIEAKTGKDVPWNDPEVREAICLALKEEEISEFLYPAGNVRLEPEVEYASEVYNLEKAKELMKEAGYSEGFKIGYAGSNDAASDKLMNYVSELMIHIGITFSEDYSNGGLKISLVESP
jgi:ABC-type transport system substrate-binding protein